MWPCGLGKELTVKVCWSFNKICTNNEQNSWWIHLRASSAEISRLIWHSQWFSGSFLASCKFVEEFFIECFILIFGSCWKENVASNVFMNHSAVTALTGESYCNTLVEIDSHLKQKPPVRQHILRHKISLFPLWKMSIKYFRTHQILFILFFVQYFCSV